MKGYCSVNGGKLSTRDVIVRAICSRAQQPSVPRPPAPLSRTALLSCEEANLNASALRESQSNARGKAHFFSFSFLSPPYFGRLKRSSGIRRWHSFVAFLNLAREELARGMGYVEKQKRRGVSRFSLLWRETFSSSPPCVAPRPRPTAVLCSPSDRSSLLVPLLRKFPFWPSSAGSAH